MYFRLLYDMQTDTDRWYLREPEAKDGRIVDARIFTECTQYDGEFPLHFRFRRVGKALSFTFGAFDVPVISSEVRKALLEVKGIDVQFIPVSIEDTSKPFWIMNVLKRVDCTDERLSEIMKWTEEDGRPEKIGEYRMVSKLVLDETKTGDDPIFRLAGWEIALIVDDVVKKAMEACDCGGVLFEPV